MAAAPVFYWIAAAVTAVSAVRSGNASAAAAETEANMSRYQAHTADIQREQVYRAAGLEEDEQRKKARQFIGSQIASSNEAGGGLNTDLIRQSFFGMEADTNAIRYDAALKGAGLQGTADIARVSAINSNKKGQAAKTSGYLNAAGSLLNAGSSYMANKPATTKNK